MKGDLRKQRRTDEKGKFKIDKKEKDFMKFCIKNDKFFGKETTNKLFYEKSTRRFYQILNNDEIINRKNFRDGIRKKKAA